MLAALVVSLILALINLILFKVKNVWKFILKCINACCVTPSKVVIQFGKAQEVCRRKIIERNIVVITEFSATPCRGRQDIDEWILINMTEHTLNYENRYASCINVTFNKVFPLPWLTCFETTRVAQFINVLLTQYLTQEQRSLELISSVAIWFLSQSISNNDELATTQREVQQRAHSQAEAVDMIGLANKCQHANR